MPEIVRLTDTDQRKPGRPRLEGCGSESVDAPVVRNLQDVHHAQGAPPLKRAPHGLLSIPCEHRGEAAPCDHEHDARVVRGESRIRLFGPDHREGRLAHVYPVSRPQGLQGGRAVPGPGKPLDVAPSSRERLFVGHDGCEYPSYPGEPDDPRDSGGVVRMVVREDERVQPAHSLAR